MSAADKKDNRVSRTTTGNFVIHVRFPVLWTERDEAAIGWPLIRESLVKNAGETAASIVAEAMTAAKH